MNKYRDAQVEAPESPIVKFNIGAAEYKKTKFEEAIKEYESSLVMDDVIKQSQGYYNIGNALYRLGKLPESILAYKKALELNPDDEDAKYNLEFVRRQLKDQSQKQQQNPQQNQEQQQQSEQNQEQQNQDRQENQEQQQEQDQQQEQQERQESQQQQASKQDISKEDAERILEALQENAEDVKKAREQKAPGRFSVSKDW